MSPETIKWIEKNNAKIVGTTLVLLGLFFVLKGDQMGKNYVGIVPKDKETDVLIICGDFNADEIQKTTEIVQDWLIAHG